MQYTKLTLRDGKPYSERFDDIYFSSGAEELIPGEAEFLHVFLKNNGLPQRWQGKKQFVIAELGLGTTLNCLLTIREWLKFSATKEGSDAVLHYIAIEKYPYSAESIRQLLSPYAELKPLYDELLSSYPPAVEASHSRRLFDGRVVVHYNFMDVSDALSRGGFCADAWFLDGFSPSKNSEMWSAEVFGLIAKNSTANTTCSTYSSAGSVKRNLLSAGFEVEKVAGHGQKRDMLVARFPSFISQEKNYSDKPWYLPPVKAAAKSRRATVVGAGIAGLTVAYSLVQRGWSVTVIDQHNKVSAETSSNPAAIVYPRLSINNATDTDFYISAYCYTLHCLNDLQQSAEDMFWFETGLHQYMSEDRLQKISEQCQFDSSFIEYITERGKGNQSAHFFDVKNAGVVLPERLCSEIVRRCGDKLTLKHAAVDRVQHNSVWQCYSEKQQVCDADVLILATGYRDLANVLPEGSDLEIEIESVRGQVAIVKQSDQTKRIQNVINAGKYFTPAIEDEHYIGATYQRNMQSLSVDHKESDSLLEELNNNIKSKINTTIDVETLERTWVGVRAMSSDRVPVVGAVPDAAFYQSCYGDIRDGNQRKHYPAAKYHEGLFVSLAHGSRGFTSAFLSAEIIAAQIEGEPSPVSENVQQMLHAARGIVNKLKRR